MKEYKIPEEEQENFASVYWQMLVALESKTGKEDILDRYIIDGAKELWEKCFGKIL